MEVSVINRKVIPNNVNDDLVNEKIRFKEVLVINSNGEQLGIKMRREALDIAFDQGLDLLLLRRRLSRRYVKCSIMESTGLNSRKKQKKQKRNSM